jgi:hypothetical protein
VHQLLDTWDSPAYVRDRRFDGPAANKHALAPAPTYTPGHNLVRACSSTPRRAGLFRDRPEIAEETVATVRAEADLRDERIAGLVAQLEATDGDFRRLWAQHGARPPRDELKRFAHPTVGRLALRRQALIATRAGVVGEMIYGR